MTIDSDNDVALAEILMSRLDRQDREIAALRDEIAQREARLERFAGLLADVSETVADGADRLRRLT